MIHEIAKELNAALKARDVPLRVVDGPERGARTLDERVVLEQDPGGDSYGPPRSNQRNPKMRASQAVGCVARVYARSAVAGATVQDHVRRAYTIHDRVLCSLDEVLRKRRLFWSPQSWRPFTPSDLEGTETWTGAVYELRFAVERGVFDREWPTAANPQGAAKPEGDFDSVANVLEVSVAGGSEEVIPFGP